MRALHHFHQLHDQHGVEEVKVGHPIGMAHRIGKDGAHKVRAVAAIQSVLGNILINLRQHRTLDFSHIGYRLNHQICPCGSLCQISGKRQPCHSRLGFFPGHAAFGNLSVKPAVCVLFRFFSGLLAQVVDLHTISISGRLHGNLASHGSAARYQNLLNVHALRLLIG